MHLSFPGFLFSLSAVEIVFFVWLPMYVIMMRWLFLHYKQLEPKLAWEFQPGKVALIIPFRNEAANVQRLAGQLAAYIPRSWEIIWVDDHSEDSSLQLLRNWIKTHGYGGWHLMSAKGVGKKRALQTGISFSSAEIIITTDADVILGQHAFSPLLLPFSDPVVNLVAGPVISQPGTGIFAFFQQIEWASILLITGAFFEMERPLMCSGANLAFRKKAFLDVNGYQGNDHILSGDDEFLLKKIITTYGPSSTVFLATKKSLIFVPPADRVGELIRQRVRWASKWRSHGAVLHAVPALVAVLFTVLPLFSILVSMAGFLSVGVLGSIWLGRFICDYLVLGRVLNGLGLRVPWFYYVITGVIHPGYVFAVSLGVIRGGFVWKGRKSKLFH